ncbi:hypothetical protein J6590_064166 [Homalodisca vitripennis]|nr:hypothetical protein J6590_064166 [Homalodisca vitripennis]
MNTDETTFLLAGNSTEELAIVSYTALNMTCQYCHLNDLVVNMITTKQLAFGRRSDRIANLLEVDIKSHTGFLVLTVDTLSWTHHVDLCCTIDNCLKNLNSCLYILKRTMQVSDTVTTRTAYYALFESHLRYGLIMSVQQQETYEKLTTVDPLHVAVPIC